MASELDPTICDCGHNFRCLYFRRYFPGRRYLSSSASLSYFVLLRTVTYADRQTYIELPFDVSEGITRVTIESSYTERDKHTTIDLGWFDGERFRGWSGGNKASFTVSETEPPHPIFLARFALEDGSSS